MFMKCDNNALQTLARLLPPAPPSTVKPHLDSHSFHRRSSRHGERTIKGTSSEILPLLYFTFRAH
jgi:hypothetical protein